MKTLAALCAAALLSGCAVQSATAINTGGYTVTAVPIGTSAYAAQVNATIAGGSAWAALGGIALLGFAFWGPHSEVWAPGSGFEDRRPIPAMAPDRLVHEQDCSKPIENPLANLRCK